MSTKKKHRIRINKIIIFVILFAVIGSVVLIIAHAAGPNLAIEPESGNITSPASIVSDASASGGQAIKFNVAGTDNCSGAGAPTGYTTLAFCDDFSGTSLNLNKWQPNWLGGSNTAISKPPNGSMLDCEDPAQVSQGGGVLKLTLVSRNCSAGGNSYSYASGYVTTINSYHPQFAYFEARMYLPPGNGACNNWPGFWTNGVQAGGVNWPVFLESDMMECLSGHPAANVHAGPTANNDTWKKSIGNIGSASGWHIFAASIKPGPGSLGCSGSTPDAMTLTYFYDNSQLGAPYSVCAKDTGQFMSIQNDIGSLGGPQVVPSTVQVDYVRSWQ